MTDRALNCNSLYYGEEILNNDMVKYRIIGLKGYKILSII
jgi:hypothetical protein